VGFVLQNKMASAMKDEFVTKMTKKFGGGLFAQKVQESMPRVTASH
jgi:hypothetical protein